MSQKKITDLQLRSAVSATCNLPVDDTTQTYRVTMSQVFTFIFATLFTPRLITAAANTIDPLVDKVIYLDPTALSFVQALPALVDVVDDTVLILKNIATNGNTATLDASGAELIDNATTLVLGSDPTMDAVTLIKRPTKWYII